MTKNIHQRIHDAMGRVDYIQKDRKQGMRYTVVSHDAVTAKVRPVLHECGIVYYPVGMLATQEGNRTQVQLTVRFANVDDPADHIDVVTLGYGVDDSDKGPGKAISYAVKYALLKTLGLETGDDPDTDQDVAHKPEARKPATVQTAAPPKPPHHEQVVASLDALSDWETVTRDIIGEIAKTKTPADLAALYGDHQQRMAKAPAEMKQRVLAIGKRHHEDLMKKLPAMAAG